MKRYPGLALLVLLAACSTQIQPPEAPNKASTVPLKNFSQVYLSKLVTVKSEGDSSDLAAAQKIEENLAVCLKQVFPTLSTDAPSVQTGALVIEPKILDVKKVNAAERFFWGPIPGSSAVLLSLTYTDLGAHAVVAAPVFYEKASAMAGFLTFSLTDRAIISDVAQDACVYAQGNL